MESLVRWLTLWVSVTPQLERHTGWHQKSSCVTRTSVMNMMQGKIETFSCCIFWNGSMPIPLWFGDSMQGQSLGKCRIEPLLYFHYTLGLGY